MDHSILENVKLATSKAVLAIDGWVHNGGSFGVMEATVYTALLGQNAVIIELLEQISRDGHQTEVNTR